MAAAISGAIAMASFVVCLFFIRFWRETGDRFFLFFAISFGVDALMRGGLAIGGASNEDEPLFYLSRLIPFLLIILAIIDKNRAHDRR